MISVATKASAFQDLVRSILPDLRSTRISLSITESIFRENERWDETIAEISR